MSFYADALSILDPRSTKNIYIETQNTSLKINVPPEPVTFVLKYLFK